MISTRRLRPSRYSLVPYPRVGEPIFAASSREAPSSTAASARSLRACAPSFGGALQEPRESQIEIAFTADTNERCVVGLRRGRNRNIAVSISGHTIGEQLMTLCQPVHGVCAGLAGVPKEERSTCRPAADRGQQPAAVPQPIYQPAR